MPQLDEAMTKAIDGFTEINNEQIDLWERLPDATPGKDEKLTELYARSERLDDAADRVENSDAINYSIKKELIENWSTQLGFNFEISEHLMYRGELGYRAGQKFFMTKQIEKTYNQSQFKDDIIFTGRIKNEVLHKLLAASHALTFVSLFEGFGIPIIEAMN